MYLLAVDSKTSNPNIGEADLRRVLKSYASYPNSVRTRLALSKDARSSDAVKQSAT